MQQRHPWLIPAAIGLQALGLGVWWESFNGLAFGAGTVFTGIVKVIFLAGLLTWWAYAVPRWMARLFGEPAAGYRLRDTLAGLPLALLPLLFLFQPLFTALSKSFSMKLTAFVWMPWWWQRSLVLKPEAYVMLAAAGVLLMAAAVAKVVVAILSARARLESATPTRLFALGFFAYLLLLTWPAITSAPQSGEISQLLVTQALAFDTGFSIERVLGRADYYLYHPVQEIRYNGYSDGLSRLWLPVSPAMPLLFIALYLLQGRWLMSVLIMAFAAGAAAQLYGLCRDQKFSQESSFAAWLITLASAPLLLYGYQLYEVTAGAFFLLWGLRQALRIGEPGVNSLSAAAAAGFSAGVLWLGSPRAIIPSLMLLVLTLLRSRKAGKPSVAFTALGLMALPLVFALAFYSSVFSVFLEHPVYDYQWLWEPGAWVNFMALIADRYAGILLNAPVWLAGLAGCMWFWNAGRRELAWGILLPLLTCVAAAMILPDPYAEGSSLNRYLAPVLPMLGVGLAAFLDQTRNQPAWQKAVYGLAAYSAAVALVQALFPFLTQEAARLKLADLVQALGWAYTLLPGLADGRGIVDLLLAGVLTAASVFLVYAGWGALAKNRYN